MILQDYFKMEITQLSQGKDLSSFTGISNSTLIIIADAHEEPNHHAIELLKRNNEVYLVGFSQEKARMRARVLTIN